MPAMSSMAERRVTMAPWCDSSLDPNASVVVVTISMANGMEATTSTTVKDSASTTEVMCARCRYTTEHSVKDTTTWRGRGRGGGGSGQARMEGWRKVGGCDGKMNDDDAPARS